MNVVERALVFAYRAHQGQVRKYSGDPYIIHPISVAELVRIHDGDERMIAAAFLHDVIEDCGVVPDDLVSLFGGEIVRIVVELTDVYTSAAFPDKNRKARKNLERQRLSKVSSAAKIVKIADMIDNSRHMNAEADFVDIYAKEKALLLNDLSPAHDRLAALARETLSHLLAQRAAIVTKCDAVSAMSVLENAHE